MKYGLIGERLGHSFSREIHGKIADYEYELCEIPRDELDGFMKAHDFAAINVTIPYKESVIPYLDEVDSAALRIGAVNTVVNRGGRLYGYNTDYSGASAMIRYAGIELCGKKVLVLGTGGTSKTLSHVARDMGAGEIISVSRSERDGCVTYAQAVEKHADANVIINTTPVGMYPNVEASPIDIADFTNLSSVVDVIYNPLETNLIRSAKERGIRAVGGLYMLAAQAVYASAHFLGGEADDALISRVYREVLREKMNIVLCGMPSCGKTTVGKKIARLTGRQFVDTDDMIRESTGREIPEIFATDGEAAFRSLEREAVASAAKLSGAVIATGGGAVTFCENVDALRQNGMIFFIDRPLECLTPTGDRPLSSDMAALKKRYDERYPIYKSVADKIIDGSGTVDEVARAVLEVLENENSCN